MGWVRGRAAAVAMCVTFAVLRVDAVGSTGGYTTPDSASYFNLRVLRAGSSLDGPLVYSSGLSDERSAPVVAGGSI
jgi:hypothetical protein